MIKALRRMKLNKHRSADLVGSAMAGSLTLDDMKLAHDIVSGRGDVEAAIMIQRLIDGWREPA